MFSRQNIKNALPIPFVHQTAQSYGYKEVCHNEVSRMLSFQKESIRINVYYTTGTVGTCLNHPRSGKTQLFRRNVSKSSLQAIFANPRVHTGDGYYKRKHITQKWKLEGTNKFLSDSARRWQYVGESTGLSQIYPKDIKTVLEIVTEWDSLYWDDGDVPDLQRTNFSCGSHGGLMKMVYEVAYDMFGKFQCWNHSNNEYYVGRDIPYNHECDNLASFMQHHRRDVKKIRKKLESLNRDVRIELMQWYIGREACGMHLADMDGDVIVTMWSAVVPNAHIDYGKTMYPKNAGLCSCCGILEYHHP